jgi:serine/threonine protein phosphatase PrpC
MNSPRSGVPKEILGMPKKHRSSSRQSSGQRGANRRTGKYGDGYLNAMDAPTPSLGKTIGTTSSPPDTSNGAFFPQIANTSSNSNVTSALAPKRSGLAQAGLLSTLSTSLSHSGKTDSNNFFVTEEHNHASVTSIRGLKPGNPNWINQDNFLVMENFDTKDTRIYGVLDGHGENGHLVSRRCRENFPHFIMSTNIKMDLAFNMMHNDLTASDIDVRCSGATCVIAVVQNGKVVVYNCGDSRAVLGRRTQNGSITAQPLSNDHKPDKPEERKRILSFGGHLGCRQVLVNQGNRGPVSMPVGPCRVWYQHRGETLGLAMSRSLGDAVVHKFGVSAEPEVIEHIIEDNDEFVIIATDGVWDVVDNNHAVQMIHNFVVRSPNWSPLEASSALCKFARSRWEKLSPMIDDITCVVVKLKT